MKTAADEITNRFIREPERRKLTGLSRSAWYRLEAAGDAPKRVKLSTVAHGWPLDEILQWIEQRKAARSKAAA